MITRKSSVVLVSAMLAACGGGGGGDGGGVEPPAPELIKMATQVAVLPENTSGDLFFLSNATDLAFEITNENPAGVGTIALNDKSLFITVGETDRPGVISGTLYSAAKGINDSSAKEISVVVENTSALAIQEQAENLVAQSDDILALSEDKAVLQFILEASYLSSLLGLSEKNSRISGFQPENSVNYSVAWLEIEDLKGILTSYQNGNTSDTALASELDEANIAIESFGDYGAQALSDVQMYSDVFFGDLTQTKLAYDPASGRYSRYLGHPSMGSYDQESWSFSPGYELLTSLIPATLTESILVCEAP